MVVCHGSELLSKYVVCHGLSILCTFYKTNLIKIKIKIERENLADMGKYSDRSARIFRFMNNNRF